MTLVAVAGRRCTYTVCTGFTLLTPLALAYLLAQAEMVRKSLGWSGAELNTKMPAGAYVVRKSRRETLFTYLLFGKG